MDTKTVQGSLQGPISPTLYLAFELSQKQWKLGFTVDMGQRTRIRTIQARDLQALQWEVQEARHRFRLPDTVTTLSCYEAGRDSFWLDRYLHAQGIANLVVDSAPLQAGKYRHARCEQVIVNVPCKRLTQRKMKIYFRSKVQTT